MQLLIAGTTGLVGAATLAQALADPGITRVVAPTRRPLDPSVRDARLVRAVVPDFSALDTAVFREIDAVACALGSTRRQATREAAAEGERASAAEAFRKRDHDLILRLAERAREAGVPRFAVVSTVGADPRARSLYLRAKGELEEALAALGFPSLTLLRPSVLDGPRGGPSRPLERLGLGVARLALPLIPARYRPVKATAVARTMLACLRAGVPGVSVVTSEAIA
jgi:uncharacterized protein YbjT (DUF2867 family)